MRLGARKRDDSRDFCKMLCSIGSITGVVLWESKVIPGPSEDGVVRRSPRWSVCRGCFFWVRSQDQRSLGDAAVN